MKRYDRRLYYCKGGCRKWNLHVRSVQLMCSEGRLPGIVKFGRAWAIPSDAEPPEDGRVTSGKYKNWRKSKWYFQSLFRIKVHMISI